MTVFNAIVNIVVNGLDNVVHNGNNSKLSVITLQWLNIINLWSDVNKNLQLLLLPLLHHRPGQQPLANTASFSNIIPLCPQLTSTIITSGNNSSSPLTNRVNARNYPTLAAAHISCHLLLLPLFLLLQHRTYLALQVNMSPLFLFPPLLRTNSPSPLSSKSLDLPRSAPPRPLPLWPSPLSLPPSTPPLPQLLSPRLVSLSRPIHQPSQTTTTTTIHITFHRLPSKHQNHRSNRHFHHHRSPLLLPRVLHWREMFSPYLPLALRVPLVRFCPTPPPYPRALARHSSFLFLAAASPRLLHLLPQQHGVLPHIAATSLPRSPFPNLSSHNVSTSGRNTAPTRVHFSTPRTSSALNNNNLCLKRCSPNAHSTNTTSDVHITVVVHVGVLIRTTPG